MSNPVLLLHGFTGSVESTWAPTGIMELLSEAGREVIAWDLPGHGSAEKHHDAAGYADMEQGLVDRLPDGIVDGVGFSMGARTLLCMASIAPEKFGKLVVAGVGRNLFERDEEQAERIAKGVQGEAADDDVHAQTFARYASEPGQDGRALAAFMRRRHYPLGSAQFERIIHPVRVVLGSEDFAGPADPLIDALSDPSYTELRGCDHFATPKNFGFIDAVLEHFEAF
ncbi:MAG: alpha/beta fold hydrolase [Actinomycetota bacterium]|jgi:pimeloyl-ACP methyl ester carboxylesterase|nr:alpha/beta fold hydrolase [Actinomycetota bacterium]|tara:strand:+ start:2590 stop:3267 length:678 start_codon:yes stop_codon:yes gene_type:complete